MSILFYLFLLSLSTFLVQIQSGVVLDLFARKVVAFRVANKATTALVIDTVSNAIIKRKSLPGLLFYSNRGTQFTSKLFRFFLDSNNITQSFQRRDILGIMLLSNPFSNI